MEPGAWPVPAAAKERAPLGREVAPSSIRPQTASLFGDRGYGTHPGDRDTSAGEPAESPSFSAVVANWRAGDTVPLGKRMLQLVALRDEDSVSPPGFVVEDIGRN